MHAAADSSSRSCTVTVPATSANLGPGFDCLGLALELRNRLIITRLGPDTPYNGHATNYIVRATGVDMAKIPLDESNLAVKAAEVFFRHVDRRPAALEMSMENCIPVGSGLGSSSSAIVAGLVGANAVYDGLLSPNELLTMAVEMEGHPDNVAPAMLGGLVLGILPDETYGPSNVIAHRWDPPQLAVVIVLPDFHLLTAEARALLPPTVRRSDAIFNASRVALLVEALTAGRYDWLRVAMGDRLHQSHRLGLIPGAKDAYQAAYSAGALGVALSGAGPSLIAFSMGDLTPIAESMVSAFTAAGLESRVWLLDPSAQGVTVAY